MKNNDVTVEARGWLERNRAEEMHALITSLGGMEMKCPYIYPPVSRYVDHGVQDLYGGGNNWGTQSPSMYVHIPYCLSRCEFCNFALDELGRASSPISQYLPALQRELASILAAAGSPRPEIKTLYFGGGTPSILNSAQISAVFALLRQHVSLEKAVEICFEVNPDTVQKREGTKLQTMRAEGVSRISVGIQSMDDAILKTLGRLHDVPMIERCMQRLKEEGFDNINVDLMYALPHLTTETWIDTLEKTMRMEPDSITLYELRIAPTSNLNECAHTRGTDRLLERTIAHLMLVDRGYVRSAPNQYVRRPRNVIQHYVEVREQLSDNIGVGVSAIATVRNFAFNGVKTLQAYMKNDAAGAHVYHGMRLAREELCTRAFVLGLKAPNGVSLPVFQEKFGAEAAEVFPDLLQRLAEANVLEVTSERIRTTDVGGFFIDQIATLFYQHADVQAVLQKEVKHLNVYWHT